MEISINGKTTYHLKEIQKKVIAHDINDSMFEKDMERRVIHVLEEKYNQSFKRLWDTWIPKLKDRGVQSIPLDEEAFAELVFSQEDYKSRSQRDQEEQDGQ